MTSTVFIICTLLAVISISGIVGTLIAIALGKIEV